MKWIPLFLLCAAALLLNSGCSMQKLTTNTVAKISTTGMVSLEGESDVAFAREASPALIKTLEVLRHGNTHNATALTLLARSYAAFTFGFVEEELLEAKKGSKEFDAAFARAEDFYRRGREYGIAALTEHGPLKKGFQSHFSVFQKALAKTSRRHVPALFWTAMNWASWINLNRDDPLAIVDLPRIEAMIDRVIALDPDYFYGVPHAFKGVLAVARPKGLGGDPALARTEFEAALAIEPDYLMTKVLYALYYARATNDRALFQRLLGEVVDDAENELEEQALANALAKRRAAVLLQKEKELF